jgi:hypothetical protein
VERWLDAHAFKATDEWVGDVRFVMYAVPPESATEMETAVSATFSADVSAPFGNQIELLGYTLNDTSFQPGDIVQLTLFWQTETPIEARYKIFLHLLDQSGNIVAQRDSEPGGGLAITPSWTVNEPIVDNHGVLLPLDLENGRFQLRLGLYDFAHPENRLTLPNGEDSYLLPAIAVHSP